MLGHARLAKSAVRLGWRMALRRPWQTGLLVFALVLPVAAGTAIADIGATARFGVAEASQSAFGDADGRITVVDSSIHTPGDSPGQLLPRGATTTSDQDLLGLPLTTTSGRRLDSGGRVVDLRGAAAPLYVVSHGTVRDDNRSIALSSALAHRLGVGIGDTITPGKGAPRTVSALLLDRYDTGRFFFVLPGTGIDADTLSSAQTVGTVRWLVRLPYGSLDPASKQQLERAGYRFTPRSEATELASPAVVADPIALLVGLAILAEVVLVVSAAFVVVVRSERRHLVVLALLGAPTSLTTGIFFSYAVALAMLGSVTGVLAGVGLAFVLAPRLAAHTAQIWGGFTSDWTSTLLLAGLVLTVTATAVLVPARRSMRQQLSDLTRETQPPPRRSTVPKTAMQLAAIALILVVINVLGFLSKLTAVTTFVALVAGLTSLCLWGTTAIAVRLNSAEHPRLPTTLLVALRSLLAFPTRAITTLIALAMVTALSTIVAVLTSSAAAKQEADYEPRLPAGAALIAVPRAISAAESAVLAAQSGGHVAGGWRTASLPNQGEMKPVAAVNDFTACVADRRLLGFGNNNWQPCYRVSAGHTPFPRVGVVDVDAVAAFSRKPMNEGVRTAYQHGEIAVPLTSTGLGKDLRMVRIGSGEGGLQLIPIGSLPLAPPPGGTVGARDFSSLPIALISPAAAQRYGLIPAGSMQYLLSPAPGHPLDLGTLRRWLPSDLQASAEVASDEGPALVGITGRLSLVTLFVAALLAAAIASSMISLWMNDLRAELQMLGAVGASPWWLRRLASTMSSMLVLVGAAAGLLWGLLVAMGFLRNVRTPLSVPLGGLTLLVIASVALPGIIGTALVPRQARSLRRAG